MPDPTAAAITVVQGGVDVLDKLGILKRMWLKLANDPDEAARHLSVALAELSSGYTALHTEIVAFSLLTVDEPGLDAKSKLMRLSDGTLAAELKRVKGSCARIRNIYDRYLTGWFSRVLNERDAGQLEELFDELCDMDRGFVRATEELSALAARFAREVQTLLRKKQTRAARQKMRKLEDDLEPLRVQLSEKMASLWDLQARFIEVARSV